MSPHPPGLARQVAIQDFKAFQPHNSYELDNRCRLAWIDVAKGVSISLVVIMHVTMWYADKASASAASFFTAFSQFTTPIRMPLFFFISGYLAFGLVHSGSRKVFKRAIGLYLIYFFWTATFIIKDVRFFPDYGANIKQIFSYLTCLIMPTVFWYIWALPAFYMITWLGNISFNSRKLPLFIIAILCLMLHHVISNFVNDAFPDPMSTIMLTSVTSNFIWFLCGLYFRSYWDALITSAAAWKAMVGLTAYLLIMSVGLSSGVQELWLKVAAAPLALWSCAQVFGLWKFRSAADLIFGYIGRMTLPVYVFHVFGIMAFGFIFTKARVSLHLPAGNPVFASMIISSLSFTLVLGSRFLGDALSATKLRRLVVPDDFRERRGR